MQKFYKTELLDLPRHRGAVRYLKVWDFWSHLLPILVLWVVSSIAIFAVLSSWAPAAAEEVFVIIGAALVYAVLSVYSALTAQGVGGAMSALGMIGGAAYYLYYDKTGDLQGAALLFRMLQGLGIGLLAAVGVFLLEIAALLVAIVCTCVNWLPAFAARLVFNICFPAWKGVVHLGPSGYESLNPGALREPRSFVINKKLRRNGEAARVLGIPVFTWNELHQQGHVDRVLQQWIDAPQHDMSGVLAGAAVGAGGVALMNMEELQSMIAEINPASGLPMLDGIGGFDVAGNTYGHNEAFGSAMDMHSTHET